RLRNMKRTLVIGASPNPLRFSNKMVKSLVRHGYEVIPLGLRKGDILGAEILTGKPDLENIHTVSLYINPDRQKEYYNYIISLAPRRIIFNPGTVNHELIKLAQENNIEAITDCSLIMIAKGIY
ncbi:MAG: CoA-binding protein, partial [Bacteroidales bacterium]